MTWRCSDNSQKLRIKFYLADIFTDRFLYQVFLRFPFGVVLLIFCLFDLFHQVAFTITMQPGLVAILAQFRGNVIFIYLEPCINKKACETTTNNRYNDKHGGKSVSHSSAAKLCTFIQFTTIQ